MFAALTGAEKQSVVAQHGALRAGTISVVPRTRLSSRSRFLSGVKTLIGRVQREGIRLGGRWLTSQEDDARAVRERILPSPRRSRL